MPRCSCASSAVVGVFLISCLPHFQPSQFSSYSAWCWGSSPPKCKAPVVAGGSCKEGAFLNAGQVCTPQCSGGLHPSGSCTVNCPPSGGTGCIDDASANTWWTPCGYGSSCLQDIQLGTPSTSQYGSFTCVTIGASSCTAITVPQSVDLLKDWGLATSLFVGGLAMITFIGIVFGVLPTWGAPYYVPMVWPLFQSRKGGLSIISLSTVFLVTVGVVVYVIGLLNQNSTLLQDVHKIKITGLAAGITVSLPMWFAFAKGGIHDLFGLSRERAWRVHAILGWLAIIFGGLHGAYVLASDKDWTVSAWWVFGFIGWLFMLIGVLPSDLHMLMPSHLRYDVFKLVHYLSALGFLLVVLHMADHVVNAKSTEAWIVFLLNAIVGVLFLAAKTFLIKLKGVLNKVTVQSVEISDESCGQHIFLQLSISSLPFKAGQWGHIVVPKVSLVPHPFTIVPLPDATSANGVQFFIKVSGKFTNGLATACAGGASNAPTIMVEGPYGIPPIPDAATNAVVFVLGGVGITPALSLVSEALKACSPNNVYLYWTCRSQRLLSRCEPFLKELDADKRAICVSGAEGAELPVGAKSLKINLGEWIESTGKDLIPAKKATLFCCGPKGLCDAAVKSALACQAARDGLCWHVHVEEFFFLPSRSGGDLQLKAIVKSNNVGKSGYATVLGAQEPGAYQTQVAGPPTAMDTSALERDSSNRWPAFENLHKNENSQTAPLAKNRGQLDTE